jgi:arylsulfatase
MASAMDSRLKEDLAHRLAVYAAMLEHLDTEIGHLVTYLKDTGIYESTVIFLLSDNGASGAPRSLYVRTPAEKAWQRRAYPLREAEHYGKQGSFPTLGAPNAQASSGPFLAFKATLFEGGTRVPMIATGPGVAPGDRSDLFVHIADLYPTIAALAGSEPEEPDELAGRSLQQVLKEPAAEMETREFGTAFMGWRAYREEPWKLVFMSPAFGGTGGYALYNLEDDPGETRDLSAEDPQRTSQLAAKWDAYADNNGVVRVPMNQVNRFFERLAEPMLAIDNADTR